MSNGRPSWVKYWFAPRDQDERRLEAWDWVVWFVYAAMLAWGVHHHLASDDESQAWLLARDSGLRELLTRRLHYEGAPGLWPILLWCTARLRLPFGSIQWISGTFALLGNLLLLRFAPFGRVFRWLLPFTFYLAYQYAVIARPYAMLAPLLWVMCVLYSLRRPRPVWFALVTGLMSNVSLHSAMLAGLFSLLYLRHIYRIVPARRILVSSAMFIVLASLSAVVAFPAPDVVMGANPGSVVPAAHPWLIRWIPPEKLPPSAPPLDPNLVSSEKPEASHQGAPQQAFVSLMKTLVVSADAASFPIAESNLLAVSLLLSFALWLRSRGSLSLAVPFALTIVLSAQAVISDHHTGQFLLAMIAAAWIAIETTPAPASWSRSAAAFGALALLVMLLQVGWTIHCLRIETTQPYDPGLATERYLAQNFPGRRLAAFNYAIVSTEPYASQKLFFNQPHSYWLWSAPVFIDRRRTEVLEQRPDAIVIGDYTTGNDFFYNQWGTVTPVGGQMDLSMRAYWQAHGYQEQQRFCGAVLMRGGVANLSCDLILVPKS